MITKSFIIDLAEEIAEIVNCETPVVRGMVGALSKDNHATLGDEHEPMVHAAIDRVREIEGRLKEISEKLFKAGWALPLEKHMVAALRAPGGPDDPCKPELH